VSPHFFIAPRSPDVKCFLNEWPIVGFVLALRSGGLALLILSPALSNTSRNQWPNSAQRYVTPGGWGMPTRTPTWVAAGGRPLRTLPSPMWSGARLGVKHRRNTSDCARVARMRAVGHVASLHAKRPPNWTSPPRGTTMLKRRQRHAKRQLCGRTTRFVGHWSAAPP
jgi:hypothetical protein